MTKHTGFYSSVDGQPIHILGDPDMDDDTLAAIQELARYVMNMSADEITALRDDVPDSGVGDEE